jgi:hypothetical protein
MWAKAAVVTHQRLAAIGTPTSDGFCRHLWHTDFWQQWQQPLRLSQVVLQQVVGVCVVK